MPRGIGFQSAEQFRIHPGHACGRLDDPRAADALDLLESKRSPDGTWRVEGKWWKPPGSKGSNVEVVDWGGRGPSEMNTLNALRILRAAGRLDG